QLKVISGVVNDQHSGERVPFASVRFLKSGIGKLTDSAGTFKFQFYSWPKDTLEISSVGFKEFRFAVDPVAQIKDTIFLNINLEAGKFNTGVVIFHKVDRGLQMWKRIVKHKAQNDRYRFSNFSYELYNKLELDLKNVNKKKFQDIKLMKPFNFILNNIDTSEGVAYLPVYLTETISDYYFQKSPVRRREVFKATKTIGVNNESVTKMLGGMDQNINFYNNFIPVFDKRFVSPVSDHGDEYYKYKVADTQYVSGRRLIHFFFTPKRKGENTFEGDCWVHDSTYAIQKMNLRLSKDANLNFVNRLSMVQEYQMVNDSTWFLAKDKFVVDITPFGKSKLSFIGRKTTTYKNIVVNDSGVVHQLELNKIKEEIILASETNNRTEEYWKRSRHEELSKTETSIYKMIDTLMSMPRFKTYTNVLNFLGTGYYNVGNYQIGPWQNWVFTNAQEGLRLRFDLGTNHHFSDRWVFHGYAAHGFGDRRWKGEFDGMYLIKKHPRSYVYASYLNDFDYGQNYYDEISADNIFALAIRKEGVPIKFIRLKEERLDVFKEWEPGISVLFSVRDKEYDPIANLPEKKYFTKDGERLSTLESSLRIRFAYLEKFLENSFYRTSLGSPLPIAEIKYSKGVAGVLGSRFDYHKLSGSVSDYASIAPFGSIYLNIFGGRTFGTLPFMFLDIAPGNEIHYYNRHAFNMMNRYEFIHDRYTGFNVEHNFGNGLFRYISVTRKLKFRQFWTAKGLWGNLSDANRKLNFVGEFPFQSLNGRTYMELGTGVDNILKVLRIDLVWRALPKSRIVTNATRFGVFGSFRLAF
ncbi:MAG TPA: DUF5686 family protein, partial [Chitinophagaceae bacterium]|nr:DUF5686 family protein [Chitinophagaceae bacterium]